MASSSLILLTTFCDLGPGFWSAGIDHRLPDPGGHSEAFPNADPSLMGPDIAFPAMLRFLPAGWIGLMVGGLIAANSSTILSHLNWGASYLVHDFYRRFLRPAEN